MTEREQEIIEWVERQWPDGPAFECAQMLRETLLKLHQLQEQFDDLRAERDSMVVGYEKLSDEHRILREHAESTERERNAAALRLDEARRLLDERDTSDHPGNLLRRLRDSLGEGQKCGACYAPAEPGSEYCKDHQPEPYHPGGECIIGEGQ